MPLTDYSTELTLLTTSLLKSFTLLQEGLLTVNPIDCPKLVIYKLLLLAFVKIAIIGCLLLLCSPLDLVDLVSSTIIIINLLFSIGVATSPVHQNWTVLEALKGRLEADEWLSYRENYFVYNQVLPYIDVCHTSRKYLHYIEKPAGKLLALNLQEADQLVYLNTISTKQLF